MINILRAKVVFSSLLIFSTSFSYAQKLQEERELEMVNFTNLKSVLEKDGLSQAAKMKNKKVKILVEKKVEVEKSRFFYPEEDELWGFISEYWLVKNAQVLNWDFVKPDYGLENSYRETLERLGFVQKKFKILLLNTPGTVRASLPGPRGEIIHLLSLPFIRSLDLSRLEISLLLLEDYFRLEGGYFKKSVETEKMRKLAGTSFHGTKPDLSLVEGLLKNYDQQINHKGFSFQQQFEVTKKMDAHLKSNLELWNAYFRLLGKLDRFLKSNIQYKDYTKLYPSPEMQLKWLSPEKKVL
jgi:hypothetical protein